MENLLEIIIDLLERINYPDNKEVKTALYSVYQFDNGEITRRTLVNQLKSCFSKICEKKSFGIPIDNSLHNPYVLFREAIKKLEGTTTTKIGNYYYEDHALERMKERHIFPIVIEDIIENGEHYPLNHVSDYELTSGGTDVYIKKNTAEFLPGKGKIGERIIKIIPFKKRKFVHLAVIVDKDRTIKTIIKLSENELNEFLQKYVYTRKRKVA